MYGKKLEGLDLLCMYLGVHVGYCRTYVYVRLKHLKGGRWSLSRRGDPPPPPIYYYVEIPKQLNCLIDMF